MTRQDIVEYLDRLRKPESVDPLHQWIGTYELTRVVLLRLSGCTVQIGTTFHLEIDRRLM